MHLEVDEGHRTLSLTRKDLVFFFLAFLFLYLQLFQFPFTPYYFPGDHLIHISVGMRLLDGEVLYRDVFQITPPGTELWYAIFFAIFGLKVWILNFTILALNLALVWLAWYFSRQLFDGWLIYLAPAIMMIVGFRLFFIDGSYRLFSVVFAFAAVGVLMRSRTLPGLIAAGVLCGLSSFFGQHRGVMALAGIGLFLIWEHFRQPGTRQDLLKKGAVLAASFALTIFLTQAYFAFSAGIDNYYFSLVGFLQKHYGSDPLSNGAAMFADLPDLGQYLQIYSTTGAFSRWIRIAGPTLWFYLLVPWVYLAFLVFRWRTQSYLHDILADRTLRLLVCVGLALSIGVSAPSAFRLSHVSMPAVIIAVWFLTRIRSAKVIASISLGLIAVVGGAYVIQRQTAAVAVLEMPAGRAAFLSELVFERYKWVGEHTKPGDLFYEAHHPSFYFPFDLKNPTPMSLIRDNDYTPKFQVDSVVRSLQSRPPQYIAWPTKWSKAAAEREPGDHLEELWVFLQRSYEPVFVFEKPPDYTPYSEGDIEIWRKRVQ